MVNDNKTCVTDSKHELHAIFIMRIKIQSYRYSQKLTLISDYRYVYCFNQCNLTSLVPVRNFQSLTCVADTIIGCRWDLLLNKEK